MFLLFQTLILLHSDLNLLKKFLFVEIELLLLRFVDIIFLHVVFF